MDSSNIRDTEQQRDVEELSKQLIIAVMNKRSENAVELINAGADPNHEDNYTALMWAAYNGDLECMRLLIDAGATVTRENSEGNSALMYAAMNNQTIIDIH